MTFLPNQGVIRFNYQASAGQMGAGSTAGNAGQLMSITARSGQGQGRSDG
jgi:hypothetical protein